MSGTVGFSRPLIAALFVVASSGFLVSACQQPEPSAPPVATPTLTLARSKTPLATPIEMVYKFVVANDATFAENYRVLVHFVDEHDELLETDDHDPPVPTSMWRPGQTIGYTRTWFPPFGIRTGVATIRVGLFAPNGSRVALAGLDAGQREYVVARLQLVPESEGVSLVRQHGWHQAEGYDANGARGWHWTEKEGTLAVKNPKRDSVVYLNVDNPSGSRNDPQHVMVFMRAGRMIDQFTIASNRPQLRKILVTRADWGADDLVDLRIATDKTLVWSQLSRPVPDPRDFGVRVFWVSVVPTNYQ